MRELYVPFRVVEFPVCVFAATFTFANSAFREATSTFIVSFSAFNAPYSTLNTV